MPRVKTQIARTDIYRRGKLINSEKTKSGKRIDRSQPYDEDDMIIISKGVKYYSWSFRYGGMQRSLQYPMPSQLTQSDFLQRVYSVSENQPSFDTKEDLASWLTDTIAELEELRDEQEEKRSNMPDSLQDAPVGEMLQNRYDSVDEWINNLQEVLDRAEEEDDEDDSDDDKQSILDDLIGEISDYDGE